MSTAPDPATDPPSHPWPPLDPSTGADPSTPDETAITPDLSSPETPLLPETPYATGQTPAARGRGSVIVMDGAETPKIVPMGLGYAVDVKGRGRLGREEEIDGMNGGQVAEASAAASRTTEVSPVVPEGGEVEDTGGNESELPDFEALRRLQKRLEELDLERSGAADGWGQRDELARMVKSLLTTLVEHLPFLQEQIQAQRETIATMQEQARLSEQLMAVERKRHVAERNSWHTETRALLNQRDAEMAAGTRPKKVLDLDVGYHQELEAANKRLEMDNRLMGPRLVDTQRQIDKLVTELRHLRSHVVLSSQPLAGGEATRYSMPHQSEIGGSERRMSGSPSKTATSGTTMGDARAEHLLLAARKVRAMRAQDDRVGRLTLEELKRSGIIGPDGGIGYSEGYGGVIEDEDNEYESELEEKPSIADRRESISKAKNKVTGTPLLPKVKRGSKVKLPPSTPSRNRGQPPPTTPGGSNFNDLLRAAELATRPGTPSPNVNDTPHAPMSATRSTTRAREESLTAPGSPTKRARREPASSGWSRSRKITGMDIDEESEEGRRVGFPSASNADSTVAPDLTESSALDLLAQASQLDMAQSSQGQSSNTPLASATRLGGMMEQGEDPGSSPRSSAAESALGPAIDLQGGRSQVILIQDHQIDPALSGVPAPKQLYPATVSTPKPRARKASITSEITTPARGYSAYPETPFDATPGLALSPPSVARSESMLHEPPPGAFASPTGATVPGLGKYVHLTSSMPARRMRSPYLKWTVEEDELLARAVAIHGEKWDLVSKGVPTRSYHQVRQRWLRKTGAFDKKPHQGGGDASGLRDEFGGEETSPTPSSGRVMLGKKRKM